MAEQGCRLTIFVRRIAPLHFWNAGEACSREVGILGSIPDGWDPQLFQVSFENLALICEGKDAFATAGRMSALEGRSLQQHASDIIVLGSVADEEIEFGNQTLE
jgi:hypothetical protein